MGSALEGCYRLVADGPLVALPLGGELVLLDELPDADAAEFEHRGGFRDGVELGRHGTGKPHSQRPSPTAHDHDAIDHTDYHEGQEQARDDPRPEPLPPIVRHGPAVQARDHPGSGSTYRWQRRQAAVLVMRPIRCSRPAYSRRPRGPLVLNHTQRTTSATATTPRIMISANKLLHSDVAVAAAVVGRWQGQDNRPVA